MNLKVLVARKRREWTQEQLAEKTDLRQADISLIEKSGWIPPTDIRQRLADALDTTPDALFDLTDQVAS